MCVSVHVHVSTAVCALAQTLLERAYIAVCRAVSARNVLTCVPVCLCVCLQRCRSVADLCQPAPHTPTDMAAMSRGSPSRCPCKTSRFPSPASLGSRPYAGSITEALPFRAFGAFLGSRACGSWVRRGQGRAVKQGKLQGFRVTPRRLPCACCSWDFAEQSQLVGTLLPRLQGLSALTAGNAAATGQKAGKRDAGRLWEKFLCQAQPSPRGHAARGAPARWRSRAAAPRAQDALSSSAVPGVSQSSDS